MPCTLDEYLEDGDPNLATELQFFSQQQAASGRPGPWEYRIWWRKPGGGWDPLAVESWNLGLLDTVHIPGRIDAIRKLVKRHAGEPYNGEIRCRAYHKDRSDEASLHGKGISFERRIVPGSAAVIEPGTLRLWNEQSGTFVIGKLLDTVAMITGHLVSAHNTSLVAASDIAGHTADLSSLRAPAAAGAEMGWSGILGLGALAVMYPFLRQTMLEVGADLPTLAKVLQSTARRAVEGARGPTAAGDRYSGPVPAATPPEGWARDAAGNRLEGEWYARQPPGGGSAESTTAAAPAPAAIVDVNLDELVARAGVDDAFADELVASLKRHPLEAFTLQNKLKAAFGLP